MTARKLTDAQLMAKHQLAQARAKATLDRPRGAGDIEAIAHRVLTFSEHSGLAVEDILALVWLATNDQA